MKKELHLPLFVGLSLTSAAYGATTASPDATSSVKDKIAMFEKLAREQNPALSERAASRNAHVKGIGRTANANSYQQHSITSRVNSR